MAWNVKRLHKWYRIHNYWKSINQSINRKVNFFWLTNEIIGATRPFKTANKGNNKITELRIILQRESKNSINQSINTALIDIFFSSNNWWRSKQLSIVDRNTFHLLNPDSACGFIINIIIFISIIMIILKKIAINVYYTFENSETSYVCHVMQFTSLNFI